MALDTILKSSLFKNYDVRGEYGLDLTEETVFLIARAFVRFSGAKRVVIGSDARLSSPVLSKALIEGLRSLGVAVEDLGLVSTDVLYFAVWHGGYDGGIMVTASHMPGKYNGMKFLRLNDKGVLDPIGRGLGMEELEAIARSDDFVLSSREKGGMAAAKTASYKKIDLWKDYVSFVRNFADTKLIRGLTVVMDAGNGMGGLVAERVFAGFDIKIIKLFFEPDGNFPNHDPNPLVPKNREAIMAAVREHRADLGIAWDADCDRCFFIDEKGDFIHGDFIAALLAIQFLKKEKGAGIVYDLRASKVVQNWIDKLGGKGYIERVGHTYIKPKMRETVSVFGGEMSGHYYFSANKYMDNGFIPALIMMEILAKEKRPLSEIISSLGEYHISGEVNFRVSDISSVFKKMEEMYPDARLEKTDGLSVSYPDWHFNVRPSANEPLLRLNLEAGTAELFKEKFKEVSALIGGERYDD
ncbi:MAG: phosphomannomutase/phosphoglucomutase [Candidatus Magasanikbacteria bacterium]|nr:phosphomannomutase/phosphoglucomutase [Candidatus Magasanikbacteria bacterium]